MLITRDVVSAFAGALLLSLLVFENCSEVKFDKTELPLTAQCHDAGSEEVKPKVKWDWYAELAASPDPSFPSFNQVMAAPMVADLDGDGVPEVVVDTFSVVATDKLSDSPGNTYSGNGVMRILDGKTGRTKHSIGGADLAPIGALSPLLIDLDGDGNVEVIYMHYKLSFVIALNSDASLRWKFALPTPLAGVFYSGLTGSDLDHDGRAEVSVGPYLIGEDSVRVPYVFATLPGVQSQTHQTTIAMPLDPAHPEVQFLITPSGIYKGAGQLVATFAKTASYLAAADLYPEIDGIEIVATGGGGLTIYNGLSGEIIKDIDLSLYNELVCGAKGVGGGPPSIGDFDGDPATLEIAVATGRHLTIFERDGVPKYKTTTQDCSSLRTGVTSFDLNGDKKPEVLYADEEYLRIFEIQNGILVPIHKIVNPTGTLLEFPVVADITGEHWANMLVASNNYAAKAFYKDADELVDAAEAVGITGLRAFESSAKRSWMPTRPLWNQFSFHPDLFTDGARLISAPVFDKTIFRRNNQGFGLTNNCAK